MTRLMTNFVSTTEKRLNQRSMDNNIINILYVIDFLFLFLIISRYLTASHETINPFHYYYNSRIKCTRPDFLDAGER